MVAHAVLTGLWLIPRIHGFSQTGGPPHRVLRAMACKSLEKLGEPWKRGAGEGTRTPDPIITNDVLYQLSYTGTLPWPGY